MTAYIPARATLASSLLAISLLVAGPLAPAPAQADAASGPDPAALELAHSKTQANDLDGAARAFAEYHRNHEATRETLLQQARVEAWRGNYPEALELLDLYREKFDWDPEYQRDRARLLAWAEQPDQAMELAGELLKSDPQDFSARFTQAIALRKQNQPAAALALAEELRRDKPSRDTEDLYLQAWTPVRSLVSATVSYYSDEDKIHHLHTELVGTYFLSPVSSMGVRLEDDYLTAPKGSGFENIDGSKNEEQQWGAIELWHRYTPWLAADVALGGSRTGDLNEFLTSRMNVIVNPAETFDLTLSEEYGYYLISPRAMSLDIRRSHYQAEANWRPTLNYTIVAQAAYDHFSDHNYKWQGILAPRRAVLRSQYFNLDLGVRIWQFSFDKDLDHGYYDPEKYQSYMATAFGYWKINRDNGISLTGAAGLLKDNTMNNYEFGWDASLEGFFGIYRDWYLRVFGSTMNNQRQNAGAYNANSGGLSLLRRF